MKALFKHLSAITQGKPGLVVNHTSPPNRYIQYHALSTTLLAVLLGVPQVPIIGSGKAIAQTNGSCPAGTALETVRLTPSDSLTSLTLDGNTQRVRTIFTLTEEFPTQVIDVNESFIDPGIYGGVQGPNLRLNIGPGKPNAPGVPGGTGNLATGSAFITITFDQPVTLESNLTVLDVDRDGERDRGRIFQDVFSANASLFNTNVPLTLEALGPFTRISGNTAFGQTENSRPGATNANVSVRPTGPGPVTQITLNYRAGTEFGQPGQDQTIGIAPFNICVSLPGTIGDTVYADANRNNIQDQGENGIEGVTVTLVGPGPDGVLGTGDDTTETTTTDVNGNYSFTELQPGNYQVTAATPTDFTPTQVPQNPVVLGPGQNRNDVDFGFAPPRPGSGQSSIGDTVYNDLNGNGQQDPGEPGISGVTVTLTGPGPDGEFGTGDDTTQTTTTDSNGIYGFSSLPAGNYRVTINNPQNFTLTQTPPSTVTLGENQNLDTVDFGLAIGVASIGDTVYNDLNGNGQQDPGEPGIAGVIVNYAGAGPDGVFGESLNDDDTSGRTTTNANGNYTFPDLPAGIYRVTINDQSQQGINGLSQTQTPTNPITLNVGDNFLDADFGFTQPTGTIGDTVYRDNNSNSTQDQGEPGIPNVEVTLTGPGPDGQFGTGDDTTVATTTTDNNGTYSFTNIPLGNYRVTVNNPPDGLNQTQAPPNPVSLTTPNQNFDTADFGFSPQQVGTIGDFVFYDNDGDSTPDLNEIGIPGITLILRDTNGNEVARTTTDDNGNYNFTVPPGTYTVTIDNPPQGLNATLTQNNPITLQAGDNINTIDFGFQPPSQGSIGDTVWADQNANGVQDQGEPGVSGVLVRLIRPGEDGVFGTGDDQTDEQFTDNTQTVAFNDNTPGQYTFNNLPPGNYQVEIVLPDGSVLTTRNNPIEVTLQPNQNINTADFGVRMTGLPGSIGDTVFRDTNGNGVQDESEPGISGVTVTLRDSNGNEIDTQNTNSNGNYTFDNLPLGNYTVESGTPNNFTQTTPTTLSASLNESNPNRDDIDFGFRPSGVALASGPANLLIVKRITNALRGNQVISGIPFNQFVDDPSDPDDDEINSERPFSVVGVTSLDTPVQSGDIVEYTIYLFNEGGETLQSTKLCDLIPDGTTFVNGSIVVNGGGTGADNGTFISPLGTITDPDFQNICGTNTPTNGAVLANLGDLTGEQLASVRFRVIID